MKEHEKIFFALCYNLCTRFSGNTSNVEIKVTMHPRQIINALAGTIPRKRCWYYLDKWARRGFYDYGVNLELGWFWMDRLPLEYQKIINEEAVKQ